MVKDKPNEIVHHIIDKQIINNFLTKFQQFFELIATIQNKAARKRQCNKIMKNIYIVTVCINAMKRQHYLNTEYYQM